MNELRIVAISTADADTVRATLRAPRYGHPAHAEVATGHGPCRHCLRAFEVGSDRRILFTHDAFAGVEEQPLPGPVFVHEVECERYAEDGGFPPDLRDRTLSLFGYRRGRRLVEHSTAFGRDVEATVGAWLSRGEVDYVQVHDLEAGCFDLRIERA